VRRDRVGQAQVPRRAVGAVGQRAGEGRHAACCARSSARAAGPVAAHARRRRTRSPAAASSSACRVEPLPEASTTRRRSGLLQGAVRRGQRRGYRAACRSCPRRRSGRGWRGAATAASCAARGRTAGRTTVTAPQDPFSTPPPGGTPPTPSPTRPPRLRRAPWVSRPGTALAAVTPGATAPRRVRPAARRLRRPRRSQNGFGIAALVLGILSPGHLLHRRRRVVSA
jgi:hypothetical protein